MMKFKVIISAIILFVVAATALLMNQDVDNPEKMLDLIISRTGADGTIVDYTNDIGLTGYHDVGWYTDRNGNIVIGYGKLEMTFTDEHFADRNIVEKLEAVGIEVQRHSVTGEYRFKYHGEPMDQWAK